MSCNAWLGLFSSSCSCSWILVSDESKNLGSRTNSVSSKFLHQALTGSETSSEAEASPESFHSRIFKMPFHSGSQTCFVFTASFFSLNLCYSRPSGILECCLYASSSFWCKEPWLLNLSFRDFGSLVGQRLAQSVHF
jgi:hypothetical protein